MKIVVLGATGGTGEQIVRQALAAGHHVTTLARRPNAVTVDHRNLRVVAGDVLDPAALPGALDGTHAVLSALGSHSGRAPTYVYSHGMTNIRAAMAKTGVRRVIAISAIPASPPQEKNLVDRLVVHLLLYRFFGGSYDDLRRMEADLRNADDVDWTVFRPPRLLDGAASGEYRTAVEKPLPHARDLTRALSPPPCWPPSTTLHWCTRWSPSQGDGVLARPAGACTVGLDLEVGTRPGRRSLHDRGGSRGLLVFGLPFLRHGPRGSSGTPYQHASHLQDDQREQTPPPEPVRAWEAWPGVGYRSLQRRGGD